MATQNYTAGGRRSAAPALTQTKAPRQQTGVTQQLMRLMQSTPQRGSPQTQAMVTPSVGGDRDYAPGYGGTGAGTTNPRAFNQALSALQAGAMLTQNRDAVQAIGQLGTMGNVASAVASGSGTNIARALGPTVAAKLGLPGGVYGMGAALASGNKAAAIDASLGFLGPVGMTLATVNALSKALTGTSVGSVISNGIQDVGLGRDVLGTDAGLIDSYRMGSAINASDDPIGSLIAELTRNDQAATPAPGTPAVTSSGENIGTPAGGGYTSNPRDPGSYDYNSDYY